MSFGNDVNKNRVIEFAESFHKRMYPYIDKIANNEPIDTMAYVKQLDGLVYAFTGCEDIIASKQIDKAKRAITVRSMCEYLSNTSSEKIVAEVVNNFDFTEKEKKDFISLNKHTDKNQLVANYMCHMGLMLCMQINPKWFLKKKRNKKNDNDTNSSEPESGGN